MKILMMPNPLNADAYAASGITSVLRDYNKFAPAADIEFVDENAESFDVLAVHAGMSNFMTDAPYVAHCHGLYWTGDYKASAWEYKANRDVISSLRRAHIITTPSWWVAHNLERDMHVRPLVLPHAIDPSVWQSKPIDTKYVLWNKNRAGDVCDPTPVRDLAMRFPLTRFISTFAPADISPNVLVTGSLPHSEMREVIMGAHLYLSTTKETFGIGILEALASGVPVLGYAEGGIVDLVSHGVDGYLARPGDKEDLAKGLDYCLKNHETLSHNALQGASHYTWPSVMRQLHRIYAVAMKGAPELEEGVTVVIPCYNYAHTLERAVESVIKQTLEAAKIIVVDDGSTDETPIVAERLLELYPGKIKYIRTTNQGVALARNTGVREVSTQYVCCLDADDEMATSFLEVCTRALDRSRELGLAYTKLLAIAADGSSRISDWPGTYNFDGFLKHQNQVPTCCVMRTDIFRRAGGYRARYAPMGAGSEDANLWLRMGALGYGGILASTDALFHYHLGGRVSSGNGYSEVDWLSPYAWVEDRKHPFASLATSKNLSHEVYQYDEPIISVVIPCSPSHINVLIDAIDSVEGQSFRKWEIIIIIDGNVGDSDYDNLHAAYPYATFVQQSSRGAGAARNHGAQLASGRYLLFLDADDWLETDCLQMMYDEMKNGEGIIYCDYIGHAEIDAKEASKLERGGRLISYNEKTMMAEILHKSADYDCDLAQRQPIIDGKGAFYIWNVITCLMPRKWHELIDGFDEKMPSWEDWDYWIRLAQIGKCFIRIEEPLLHYRFYTGERREIGRQHHSDLIDYMLEKYGEVEIMPCSGCRGRTARIQGLAPKVNYSNTETMGAMKMTEDSMVLVEVIDGNIAKHPVSMRDADGSLHNYGYKRHGEQFLMRRDHLARFAHKFRQVTEQHAQDVGGNEPDEEVEEIGAPTRLEIFTTGENDVLVAQAERDERIAPKAQPTQRRTQKKKTTTRGSAPNRRTA